MATKRTNRDGLDAVGAMTNFLQSPSANGFLFSQQLAMEATRFWARRMRAYADQMEACARCTSPEELVSAQQRFIARLQEDYAQETSAMSDLMTKANEEAVAHVRSAANGASERPNA